MRSEQIVVVPHAIARMHERGLDFLDVQRCLRRGRVTRGPYNPPDSATGELRYDIEAFVDEDCLRVVVELPERSMDVTVVTVFVVE
jgi:hypothetical protein